jgi:hypothetical protein
MNLSLNTRLIAILPLAAFCGFAPSVNALAITNKPHAIAGNAYVPDPQQLLNSVPNGGSISWGAFAAQLPQKWVTMAAAFAPKTISRQGNHVRLDCDRSASTELSGGITVQTGKVLACDIVELTQNHASLTRISGITFKSPFASGKLLAVNAIRVTQSKSNVTITIQVGFVPLSFTLTVDSNGTVTHFQSLSSH